MWPKPGFGPGSRRCSKARRQTPCRNRPRHRPVARGCNRTRQSRRGAPHRRRRSTRSRGRHRPRRQPDRGSRLSTRRRGPWSCAAPRSWRPDPRRPHPPAAPAAPNSPLCRQPTRCRRARARGLRPMCRASVPVTTPHPWPASWAHASRPWRSCPGHPRPAVAPRCTARPQVGPHRHPRRSASASAGSMCVPLRLPREPPRARPHRRGPRPCRWQTI